MPDDKLATSAPVAHRAKRTFVIVGVASLVIFVILIAVVGSSLLDQAAASHAAVKALEAVESGSTATQEQWMLHPQMVNAADWRKYMLSTKAVLDGNQWQVAAVHVDGDSAWALVLIQHPGSSDGPDPAVLMLWRHGPMGWQVLDAGPTTVFADALPGAAK